MKKWRPGTVEVQSYLVLYQKNGEKLAMYVQAEHERDARQQVMTREGQVSIHGVERRTPDWHDEEAMNEYTKELLY